VPLDGPDARAIGVLLHRVFPVPADARVERAAEGVSTYVYRVRRRSETFYLRVLPEVGASFAPEALVHTLLRERGVSVPEVICFEHVSPEVGRSTMLTREIPGEPLSCRPLDGAARQVLFEAGQQLAVLNSILVDGFGWICRSPDSNATLTAELPTLQAFVNEHLDADLALLAPAVLTPAEAVAIRALVDDHTVWLAAEQATLAHGDFDLTQIYHRDGQYRGIIDLGEIRGAHRWYDLAHARLRDGETMPVETLPWLLEGYGSVVPLPVDIHERLSFASLLIGVRVLGRALGHHPPRAVSRHVVASIRRDLGVLRV
jgi:aminoglycoside phosphotransferase